ncbi:MAG: hypothetical protein C5B50_27990 [Verrucomicrobia bacterium]|nr:MAG: hypothetical protein C5B50_27990 [Verrucomicrobiota bacterium]
MTKPKRRDLIFAPPPNFCDPRLEPGFERACWPLCDGGLAPPPNSPGLHERRCIEFLAAFYHINVLNKRLRAARRARPGVRTALSARAQGVRTALSAQAADRQIRLLLKQISTALTTLELLEDRYAPIGFFGEPIMDGTTYKDIVFVRPELPKIHPSASTISSHFAIPGLDKIPAEELRGPMKVFRFGHGKVDF